MDVIRLFILIYTHYNSNHLITTWLSLICATCDIIAQMELIKSRMSIAIVLLLCILNLMRNDFIDNCNWMNFVAAMIDAVVVNSHSCIDAIAQVAAFVVVAADRLNCHCMHVTLFEAE